MPRPHPQEPVIVVGSGIAGALLALGAAESRPGRGHHGGRARRREHPPRPGRHRRGGRRRRLGRRPTCATPSRPAPGLCDAEAVARRSAAEGPAQVTELLLARGRLRPRAAARLRARRARAPTPRPASCTPAATRPGPTSSRPWPPRCARDPRVELAEERAGRWRSSSATGAPPACARPDRGRAGVASARRAPSRSPRAAGPALRAHHQPAGRDGRRPRPRRPRRRRARRPRAGAVPPHGARPRRRPAGAGQRGRPRRGRGPARRRAGTASCPTSTRWPSSARATWWRARSPGAPPSWARDVTLDLRHLDPERGARALPDGRRALRRARARPGPRPDPRDPGGPLRDRRRPHRHGRALDAPRALRRSASARRPAPTARTGSPRTACSRRP